MMNMKIEGITQVTRYLGRRLRDIQKAEERGIKKATQHTLREVKKSIAGDREELRSVDTGRFLNSVQHKTSSEDGIVYTLLEYAPYLEHGTRVIDPRRHFQNTKAREQPNIHKIIKKEIRQA